MIAAKPLGARRAENDAQLTELCESIRAEIDRHERRLLALLMDLEEIGLLASEDDLLRTIELQTHRVEELRQLKQSADELAKVFQREGIRNRNRGGIDGS